MNTRDSSIASPRDTSTLNETDISSRSNRTDNPQAGKKKRRVVKLTYRNARTMQYEVQINLVKHIIAARFFGTRHRWFFAVPIGILTCASSILAFLGDEVDIFGKDTGKNNHFVVGGLAAVVIFWQTLSGLWYYDKREDRHRSTACQLRDLRDELRILVIKFKYLHEDEKQRENMNMHGSMYAFDQKEHDDAEEELGDSFDLVQKKFQQSLSGCSSYVPLSLGECFHGLISNLELRTTVDNEHAMKEIYTEFDNVMLTSKAIDILAGEIISYRWYPLALPNPKEMVKQSTDLLEKRLEESIKSRNIGRGEEKEKKGIISKVSDALSSSLNNKKNPEEQIDFE